ncbi:MAG: dynamin family protein [Acidobacteria bacterium]|nr:dynamin family protein [Acidobacteriota bacterium]MBV9476241.1 dynamin family protein [Acidobacteriota bacterium]
MPGIFDTVVDPRVQSLLRREQRLLVELRETLEREQGDERRRVEELLATLEDLFTIVIVGEFNAGKSSLINALFGAKLRVEGPIPVDDVISILRYGEQASQKRISDYVTEQFYPVDFLRNITLVDTPGTNSIVQRHQEITEDFIPRADLVLFVTSIDRPLSESERRFLEYIREWGKKVVFVLNKVDTKSDDEIAQVLDYLKTNTRAIFGFDPTIYPTAAKLALEAKLGNAPPRDWTRSRFEALEDYIFQVLSEKERVRLKLAAPLETILSLSRKQFRMIESRREVLAADQARITSINDQLERARADLQSNFRQFVIRIDNLMMDLERRGIDFLERYVRIQHVMMLRDALRFREEFDRQVFAGWKGNIDATIQEAVDWIVRENMKLWSGTVEAFHRRAESDARNEEIVGRVGREFAYNREEVYARMRTNAEQRLAAYDVNVESRRIIDNAMRAVLHSFGLGAGALGLGYLLTTAVSSTAVDVTGLTAATMLLVTSFLILPYKRSKAKDEFRRRIEELRTQLQESLDRESSTEIDRMLRSITSAFEPYQRFYAAESEKIERFAAKLTSIDGEARAITGEIEKL